MKLIKYFMTLILTLLSMAACCGDTESNVYVFYSTITQTVCFNVGHDIHNLVCLPAKQVNITRLPANKWVEL